MITEYTMLAGHDVDSLSDLVTRHLADGWRPYCGPCVDEELLFQAVVKDSTPEVS